MPERPSFWNDAPRAALALGFSGLIPFLAGACAVLLGLAPKSEAGFALLAYGAIILSFLGGIRWGYAVLSPERKGWLDFGLSVLPSLIGWAALLLPVRGGLLMVAAALGVCFAGEIVIPARLSLPRWYFQLRAALTGVASISLLLSALVW